MLRTLKTLAAASLFTAAGLAGVSAQTAEPRVVVPDAPGGAFVSGCYRADRPLYGPYRLVFCLDRRGTYTVRGPNLSCDGRLDWKVAGSRIDVHLRRQSCNRGLAWAEANISCRPRSLVSAVLDELLIDLFGAKTRSSRVVVPDRPTVGKLTCTYSPTVAGAGPRDFFARRLLEPRS